VPTGPSVGAEFVVINPLHASSPARPQQPSPYFPGSRCFLNPLYLSVERVPGAAHDDHLGELAAAGRTLNDERLIDRDRVWELKSAALERLFAAFTGAPEFDAYVAERGETLQGFATFSALAERHGAAWQSWPSDLRDSRSAAVRAFAISATGAARVRYHSWLQWLLDGQLAAASTPLPLVSDLAVGVDPGGADAWLWQESIVSTMRIGAPPDVFNTRGQDWALPPFDPWRVGAAAYEPWVQSIRGALRHGGGLRLDHVMGLFRLFWIPVGESPARGAYVRYPHDDLLNIVALEAYRAGAFVVGEDLGTVEPGVRSTLRGRDILSYRVWWFERDRPPQWPPKSLGSVTTHDLPTVAGLLTGSDLAAQRRLGMEPNEAGEAQLRRKLLARTHADDSTPVPSVIERVHADLATAPCLLLTATLDDALAVEERPNMPTTVDEWPNWRLALPRPLEDIEQMDLPHALAVLLNRNGATPVGLDARSLPAT
jgi:4-alpha-glucanotransferase